MNKKIFALIMILLFSCLAACGDATDSANTGRVYECDYKTLSLNTKITTTFDGEKISITGNLFTLFTDPLTVKDSKGTVLGYAGDVYGIISQDDHGIYIGETFDVNMCGNVDLWGESYTLKDAEGNIVATIEFNLSNTEGKMVDTEGNIIATYSSAFLMNDYVVTIYDNDVCSDLSILMVMASYVSDYIADSKSN